MIDNFSNFTQITWIVIKWFLVYLYLYDENVAYIEKRIILLSLSLFFVCRLSFTYLVSISVEMMIFTLLFNVIPKILIGHCSILVPCLMPSHNP